MNLRNVSYKTFIYGGYIALIKVQRQNNMRSEIFLDLYGVRPLTFFQICALHPAPDPVYAPHAPREMRIVGATKGAISS